MIQWDISFGQISSMVIFRGRKCSVASNPLGRK